MALTKPILNSVGSFDAHVGFKFTFQVVGGDKVTGCRLTIFNNTTNVQIYQDTQTHESYDFTLPANASGVTNKTSGAGGNYNAYIETTDGLGNWSEPSSRMQFYCFVTPVFEFTVDTTTITSATNTWFVTHAVNPTYPTEDIDGLATYGFTLYNNDGSQAQTSGTLFTASRPDLNYTFSGLLNGATYKIQAVGMTNNQMQVSTVLDTFIVAYDLPVPSGVISATNICNEGYVVVQVDISGIANLENYQYARIYRKDANNVSEDWLLLIENYVTMLESGIYVYNDRYNRNGVTYEYALALVEFSGIESGYTTTQVLSEFDGVFLLDLFTTYKIYAGAKYGDTTSVQKVGVHEPFGSQYPILVYNAKTDYQRGSVSASVLDNNYDTTREINRFSVTQQIGVLDTFLKNQQAKILKDWNGNIWLCSIIGDPSISYNSSFGMGYIECNFEWVEQGKYDNHDDLLNGGLLSAIPPVSVKFTGLSGMTISLSNNSGDLLNATIGESGETIVTTYTVGAYTGTVSLTNEFGTQIATLSANIEGGILNTVNVPHYHLTINGEASVYGASSAIHLENNGSTIDSLLASEIVIPVIQTGTWSGYALAYVNQKQPISILMEMVDNTLTIETAATLTITSPSDISYSLSNTNGGFTNTISGSGNGVYKLFTSGTWSGTALATGNQSAAISVSGITYGGAPTYTIPYTELTFSVTARLDNSVPFTLANGGASIPKTFSTTNGAWVQSTTGNSDDNIVYGNGYFVSFNKNTNSIKYSNGTPPLVWTTQVVNASAQISDVAFGNNYWVITDYNGKVYYRTTTPNGTWTASSVITPYGLSEVEYANGYWVASVTQPDFPGDRGVWYRQTNPTGAWTQVSLFGDNLETTPLGKVYYGNGYWVCTAPFESGFWYKATDPTGIWTFKAITLSGVSSPYPLSIAYGNGYWAIVDPVNNCIYYISGALTGTWLGYLNTGVSDMQFYNIEYSNDYWIITYQAQSYNSAGIYYRYGTPISAANMVDWMKQTISGTVNIDANIDVAFSDAYILITGGTYTRYHVFPNPQSVAQTAVYSLIKSGTWSGSAVIDNYTKAISTVVPATPSGSVTLDIKDKALT